MFVQPVQGKFWEFAGASARRLSRSGQDGDNAAMSTYAKGAGLDEVKFTECLGGREPLRRSRSTKSLQFGQEQDWRASGAGLTSWSST